MPASWRAAAKRIPLSIVIVGTRLPCESVIPIATAWHNYPKVR